jgi:hypothetical protein
VNDHFIHWKSAAAAPGKAAELRCIDIVPKRSGEGTRRRLGLLMED